MTTLAELVFEQIPFPKLVLDACFKVRLANKAACRHFQALIPSQTAEGECDFREIEALLSKDERLQKAVSHALATSKKVSARPDFVKQVETTETVYDLRRLKGEKGADEALILIEIREENRSVSAFKMATEEGQRDRRAAFLERQNARELSILNKNLQQFAHAAAHDMREPVRIIATLSDMLLHHGDDAMQERKVKFLRQIHQHAMRAQRIVRDIMAFSSVRHSEFNASPVDLAALVRSIWRDLRETAPEGVSTDIRIDIEHELHCDARMFEVVFRNLISNSIKYRRDDAVSIKIVADRLGAYDQILYLDHGLGFDDSKSELIFEPFKRLHTLKDVEGSGVGLATCQQIVERHHGRIWATGVAGEGAMFFINIPRKKNHQECADTGHVFNKNACTDPPRLVI